jgi:hypothetical protein
MFGCRRSKFLVGLCFTSRGLIGLTSEFVSLVPMIYVPPHLPLKYTEWPTLGEMIDTRKRLVVFMDSKANASVVPWILPQPQMVPAYSPFTQLTVWSTQIWEDPFTVTNASFPCSVSRVHGPLPAEDHTYLINHSLHKKAFSPIIDDVYIPDRGNLSTTNSLAS